MRPQANTCGFRHLEQVKLMRVETRVCTRVLSTLMRRSNENESWPVIDIYNKPNAHKLSSTLSNLWNSSKLTRVDENWRIGNSHDFTNFATSSYFPRIQHGWLSLPWQHLGMATLCQWLLLVDLLQDWCQFLVFFLWPYWSRSFTRHCNSVKARSEYWLTLKMLVGNTYTSINKGR